MLATSTTLESYAKFIVNPEMTLVFSIIGYTLRPTCAFLFILLTINTKNNKIVYLGTIPLIINLTIYLLCFNPELSKNIVYFTVDDGEVNFNGGILRYTSHVISLAYLVWFMYLSLSMIRFKRILRGITTMACSLAVIAAAIVESFLNNEGNIFVLNTAIAFSCLFYYVYLIIEDTEIDRVTGLYNEERYYHDIDLNFKNINGVAVFHFSLLKESDDNYLEINNSRLGKAGATLIKCINRKMIVYRMDNNEFLLFTKSDKESLKEVLKKYQTKMNNINLVYSVSFAFKEHENEPIRNLIFEAERVNKLKNLSNQD